jgi:hypothetical protein
MLYFITSSLINFLINVSLNSKRGREYFKIPQFVPGTSLYKDNFINLDNTTPPPNIHSHAAALNQKSAPVIEQKQAQTKSTNVATPSTSSATATQKQATTPLGNQKQNTTKPKRK